jgi:internalin A
MKAFYFSRCPRYIGNNLNSLPKEIVELKRLKRLQFCFNQLSQIPTKIFQISSLIELDLRSSKILNLPLQIGDLVNLKRLYISQNTLNKLPSQIGQLINLEILELNFNKITELPIGLGKLSNLIHLEVAFNELNKLPSEIGNLQNLYDLNLNCNNLLLLPKEIGNLWNLNILDASANHLHELPKEIGELRNLKDLILNQNSISFIPREIKNLSKLETFSIDENKLAELPKEIGQLNELVVLEVNDNDLTEIPVEIGQLSKLFSLEFSNNKISVLPAEIGQLVALKYINMSMNNLHCLPAEFIKMTELEDVDLSCNYLNEFPLEITQLANLKDLILSDNNFSFLPLEIGLLINLERLHLSSNRLRKLPSEIKFLRELKEIDISSNNFSSFPLSILDICRLEKIYCSRNRLEDIPGDIARLSNLESIFIASNNLNSLPSEISQLSNLRTLVVSHNNLESLPSEMTHLNHLEFLYANNNKINLFPIEITYLSKLKSLNLSGNKIEKIPAEIINLSNLKSLSLSSNEFGEIPLCLFGLTAILELDLKCNQLDSLPSEMCQLTNLEKLDLRGNPLPIAPEILGPKDLSKHPGDVKAILDFYFTIQDPNATETLYEAKFLIVGEGGAGKTSLAKKIQNPDYKLNPDEDSTHGIEVIQWRFPLEDGQEFRTNLWDFGGQEIYHQTHQFFLTERALYALVADERKENTDFPYWLSSIELFGGDSPVLVIKNEKNDRPCTINEKQLRGEFQHIKEFFPTNLKDGRGLDAIKDAIRYHITRLDHVGQPLPKKWVRVRYALENDARNYIDQRDYFALCEGNGVSDRTEMLRISDFLHKLGICLHFQSDAVLKHLVILRPEWATNAVYAITKNADVIQDKGVFTRETAEAIWQQDYANLGDELLQLMQKFNLCYPIPGLADHYIAPQLLEFTPPDYDWDDNANLMLRYEYEFMPKGVITQLIVRLHRWIEQQQLVWRNGVVLNNGRARAEVIETYRPYKGELFIKVSGIDRKELFSVVANEVDQINDSFEKIKVAKEVPCNCEECRDSDKPHFFKLENLYGCLQRGRYEIPCFKSYQDVSVRQLTAVVTPVSFDPEADDPDFEQWKWDKRSEGRQMAFDRLKQQHTEYYQPMSEPKYQIVNPQNVQIVETTAGGDAVIHKYASDPQIKSALEGVLQFLDELQQQHPDATPDIINGEIVHVQQTQPNRWQKLRQQFRTLPRDLRNPERLKQAGKAALIQVTTDLTDNIALNAVIAALDGLSDEP